jgi:hypothetical protein
MKIYSPVYIVVRVILYALFMYGIAEGIFYDAGHPWEGHYFGENTFTEIGQEVILFILFVFYLTISFKWKEVKPVALLVSLFFLMSFIREFNFILDQWIYPVAVLLLLSMWILVKNYKKITKSTKDFFAVPASSWLLSGLLITYIFSRLLGRSKFWRLLYEGENYRLAKAATEEGIELLGDTLMLIGAIEFLLYFLEKKKVKNQSENS